MAKKSKPATRPPAPTSPDLPESAAILADLRGLIDSARSAVAQTVNTALVLLYWEVGRRIRADLLGDERAAYGDRILPTLSAKLTPEYGAGFGVRNLARMVRFAEVFADRDVVLGLARHLGWSHFVEILPLKTDLHREFYAELCRVDRWSIRTLRDKVAGMLFERTTLSRQPDELVRMELAQRRVADQLAPDLVFRDPYLLDFLGLADTYSESDLETAILREMERFLLELGAGFAFVARQKRIIIDGHDFAIDLLFYHRKLRRLVAIDLKLGAFRAADKGQMELYLRWLEKHEVEPGEETPLGLILCAEKGEEQVELLRLDRSGIHVATYLTELPPRDMLERRLRAAVEQARKQHAGTRTTPEI